MATYSTKMFDSNEPPAVVATAEDNGESLAGEIAAALDGLQRATQLLSRGKVAAAREACNHVGTRLIGR